MDGDLECVLDLVWSIILRYSLCIAIFDEQNIADDNISIEAVRERYVLFGFYVTKIKMYLFYH